MTTEEKEKLKQDFIIHIEIALNNIINNGIPINIPEITAHDLATIIAEEVFKPKEDETKNKE